MKNQRLENLIAIAKALAGRPYKYGAGPQEAPAYFDCSSFIQYLYKRIGIKLPRCTIEQVECGREVKNQKSLKPGDLIFFRGEKGHYNKKFPMGIGHVAMHLGNDKIIHATSKRIQNYPKIIEKGEVKIEPLVKILKRQVGVVIKRILD